MIVENKYPILEFDDNKIAKINPDSFAEQTFKTDKLIITFFPEVINKLADEGKIILERTISGENPVLIYRFLDNNILITLGQVGCPACARNLDLFNTMGITKVMFCGGGGVLDKNIGVGQILVVDGAIRDEGFSYHYIEPSRYIYTNPATTGKITQYLDNNQVSYIRGLTWTTDAIFRETPDKIAQRKKEGAKIVEMEQAGCIDGFFGKKEYAAIPETKFVTKLQQLLCLECSIWHIFLRKPLKHLQILLQHVFLKVFCQKAPGFLSSLFPDVRQKPSISLL